MCRGLLISSAYISYVGKHACELGLISGTPNGYQLKVEIPALLKFHPHLEVKGIPSDVLSDPGSTLYISLIMWSTVFLPLFVVWY